MNPEKDKQPQMDPQPVVNDDSLQTLIPTKNKPALIGYYFGIFGLLPFIGLPLAIVAIVLGKKGLNQYNAKPTPGAKVHAMIALVLGIIEVTFFTLFVLIIIIAHQTKQ